MDFDVNRYIFPSHVGLYVQNDAVAALASGTMGKLHGCVLIAGTGTIAYGFTEDGREARAAGAGPILGDWGRYRLLSCFRFLSSLSLSYTCAHTYVPDYASWYSLLVKDLGHTKSNSISIQCIICIR